MELVPARWVPTIRKPGSIRAWRNGLPAVTKPQYAVRLASRANLG